MAVFVRNNTDGIDPATVVDPRMVLDPDVIQNPYPFYDALRVHAPVWRAGDAPVYLVTRYALVAEAARRVGDFSSEMHALLYRDEQDCLAATPVSIEPTLPVSDPPLHTLHKQFIFPNFVSKRMMLIESNLSRRTQQCLDRIAQMEVFDFMEHVGGVVPAHAMSLLLGLSDDNDRDLITIAYNASEMTGGTMTLDEFFAAQQRSHGVSDWLTGQLAARDGTASNDLMDAIRAAVDQSVLTERQASIFLITLLSAGAESTASLLGNAVRILADQPGILQLLRDDPALLPNFIEEAGRIESPFRHHLRHAPADTELGGVHIPAGSTLLLMWGAANRDPDQFASPNTIGIGRKQQHMTFGRGIHLCIGAALARMEARVVLSAMLARDRFPVLARDCPPRWEHSLMVRRYARLPMAWA